MRPLRTLLALAPVFLAAGLNAQVVFQDKFEKDGPLENRPVETGAGVWQTNLPAAGGFVPFAPGGYLNIDAVLDQGKRYQLSFDVINAQADDFFLQLAVRSDRVTKPAWLARPSSFTAYLKPTRIELAGGIVENYNAYHPETSGYTTTYRFIFDLRSTPGTLQVTVANSPVSPEPLPLSPDLRAAAISFLLPEKSNDAISNLTGALDNIELTVLP